jgi:hypothetical protein
MKLIFITIIFIISSNCFCQSENKKIFSEPILISKTKDDPGPVAFDNLVECKSKNGDYSILLPSDWNTSIIINKQAGIQVMDNAYKLSIFIIAKEITPDFNLRERAAKEIRQAFSDYKNSEIISDQNIIAKNYLITTSFKVQVENSNVQEVFTFITI